MTKAEQEWSLIEALVYCKGKRLTKKSCAGCPYAGAGCAIDATIAKLKAQEPRVMTLEEAKSAFVIEYRSGKMREVGSTILDLDVDPLNAEYGKIYRVWTSRPDEKRRTETPWEQ